jgi:hypothetical protein
MNADIRKSIMQKTIRGAEVHLEIFDQFVVQLSLAV